ncbi:MAG: CotH kinase family protein [Bacteroidales bacterium]|jgi:hypothetical protein|nr:CotH kinase family protein [Bacteroidales bacterium]MCK9499183.1 CotH kinase family protein [Bacteroidales bacterium]MDY0314440.1 CotH kinase family protein [Bacteroidales bacterium]
MAYFRNILILLFVSLNSLYAQQIVFEKKFYHIDESKKLILINKSIESINSETSEISAILLNKTYFLSPPVSEFELGRSYSLIDGNYTNYILYFTEFPIINIECDSHVPSDFRALANFKISESNGNVLENIIGIELQGSSSLFYPKKNYRIEFWVDPYGMINKNVSLLGMRNDDDWSLLAMYIEPLRIRTKSANELWLQIHKPYYSQLEPRAINGTRNEYVELFFNGEYNGIYCLGERIDQKQLQLKEFKTSTGIRGELYKGQDWGGATEFKELEEFEYNSEFWSGFKYKYPKEEIDWSILYNFVDFVINSSNTEFYANYKQKFDVNNSVDYYLFLNLMQAYDNQGKNIYIAKYDKNEVYFYVPWDLDATFDLDWNGSYSNYYQSILSNGFYNRLIHDCSENGFNVLLKNRWNSLRQNVLTYDNIISIFRENFEVLQKNAVYEREHLIWGDDYVFYENGFAHLENWVQNRLEFLDNIFSLPCEPQSAETFNKENWFAIYPNPNQGIINIELSDGEFEADFSLISINGVELLKTKVYFGNNQIDLSQFSNGIYLGILKTKNKIANTKIIVKY